ncbi:MAG TPA: hypothetical protein VHA12_00005, partial [Candidatus Nanoarchaeia archaeon]|nr:hypothetical protein [Candidatus Nanoarchaeia archaeon]
HGTLTVAVEAIRTYGLITKEQPNYKAAYAYVQSHATHKAPTYAHFKEYVEELRSARLKSQEEVKHGRQKLLTPVKTNPFGNRPVIRSNPKLEERISEGTIRGMDLSKSKPPFASSRERH